MITKATLVEFNEQKFPIDKKEGIFFYGEKNDYPQKIQRIVNSSVTASAAVRVMSTFLSGQGYGEIDGFIINQENQMTLRELANDIVNQLIVFKGCYVHFEIVKNGDAYLHSNPKIIPFPKVRIGKKDSFGFNGLYKIKERWEDKNEKAIAIRAFNPIQKIIEHQVESDGGLSKHTGHILYYSTDNSYVYPLSRFDSVLNDCDTENQLSIYKNRLLRKGFFGKTMFVTRPLIDPSIEELHINENGERVPNRLFQEAVSEAEKTKKVIENFIGAENAEGAMVVEMDFAGEKLEDAILVKNISADMNPDVFSNVERTVRENILMACNNMPIALVRSSESVFGNSGEMISKMSEFFWANTDYERGYVEMVINDILNFLGHSTQVKTLKTEKW